MGGNLTMVISGYKACVAYCSHKASMSQEEKQKKVMTIADVEKGKKVPRHARESVDVAFGDVAFQMSKNLRFGASNWAQANKKQQDLRMSKVVQLLCRPLLCRHVPKRHVHRFSACPQVQDA